MSSPSWQRQKADRHFEPYLLPCVHGDALAVWHDYTAAAHKHLTAMSPMIEIINDKQLAGDFLRRDCCDAREMLRADFVQGGVLRLASKSLTTALEKLSNQVLFR